MNTSIGSMSLIKILCVALLFGVHTVSGQDHTKEKPLSGKEILIGEFGEASIRNLAGKRDLSRYEHGGHSDFRTYTLGRVRGNANLTHLAEFLVEKLKDKKLAYARASFNSPDAGATYHYFVEPDPKGDWGISTRMVGWHALGLNRVVDFPRADSLVKSEHDSKIIALKFFRKSGEEIQQLVIR